ncbi:hypothetical protein F5Y18DRAFT_441045 [Xylariaceae sp. FL1019]|nr:hypothetical protein F5Y18DRAFT_441045 [Xylariaceae sp. FL1019]
MVNFGPARDQYPTKALIESYLDREGSAHAPDDRHPDLRRPPLPIDEGLRNVCQIPGTSYFVAATQENGELIYLYSPSGSTSINPNRFFDETAFRLEINRVQNGGNTSHGNPMISLDTQMADFASVAGQPTSRHGLILSTSVHSAAGLQGLAGQRTRRNPKATPTRRGGISTTERPRRSPATDFRRIALNDEEAVWALAVEPRKQTTHPYTRGEEGKPDWWPRPWGPQPDQRVIHKEPDHIPKAARVRLLVHILRMVVEPPENQHPAILRVRLNIEKLKVITFETLSGWFADVDHPANAQKRRFVTEIFTVALKQEEYKSGEADGLTEVFVMNENGVPPEADESDNEEMDNMPASTNLLPPLRQHDQMLMPHVYTHDHTESRHSTPNSYASSVTMRDEPYDQATFSPEFSSERPNFVHEVNLMGHGSNYAQEHLEISDVHSITSGGSRRPSLFTSQTEYPASWPGSNAPDAPTMFAFPTQAAHAQSSFEMANNTAYTGHVYDGLPRQENDNVAHGVNYPSRAISHDPLHTQPPYHNYEPEGNGS